MAKKIIVIALFVVFAVTCFGFVASVHPPQYTNMTASQVEAQMYKYENMYAAECDAAGGTFELGGYPCTAAIKPIDTSWEIQPIDNQFYDVLQWLDPLLCVIGFMAAAFAVSYLFA